MAIKVQALKLFAARGYSMEEGQKLLGQMMDYKVKQPPFILEVPADACFNVKSWWLLLATQGVRELSNLAIFLYDICPHAAVTERIFSSMGWFHTDNRSRLDVASVHMLTAVKMSLSSNPIKYGCCTL